MTMPHSSLPARAVVGVRALFPIVALCLLLLATAGCVHVQQEIAITGPNTGRMTLDLAITEAVYDRAVEGGEKALYPPLARFFIPGAGAAHFSAADGFEVKTYRIYEDDGWRHIYVDCNLADLDKAFASGKLGAFERVRDGDATIVRLKANALPQPAVGATDKARIADLQALVKGMKVVLVIRTPTPILATTAPQHKESVAVWSFDPAADPAFLATPPTISVRY